VHLGCSRCCERPVWIHDAGQVDIVTQAPNSGKWEVEPGFDKDYVVRHRVVIASLGGFTEKS